MAANIEAIAIHLYGAADATDIAFVFFDNRKRYSLFWSAGMRRSAQQALRL